MSVAVPARSRARSPPRPVKKDRKPQPPSPPLLIKDTTRQLEFQRLGFLGEGGFACVYEAQDMGGRRLALKCVSKLNLETTKTKTKLYAEIRLHKMLDHPNVVGFKDCFDDDENVYMGLELCEKGSMMDVLRKRKGMTEPEVRYWLVQLIGACAYMHGENVIHRDLKLGNIFLDGRMDVKVGDFGLAALIENEGDRKKTICGTPNYIAPEVLFDTANGHSFEVDVWSIGVIMYTLIIGRPPFQTKEIKAIYKRIKENSYDFPPEKPISKEAQDLVTQILTIDPRQRPTLHDILLHPFFQSGPFPSSLPSSASNTAPDFRHLTAQQSAVNFGRVRTRAFQTRPIATSRVRASLGPSVAQQEREFNRAVQPDSPLSALLSSARQPLLVSHEPNIHRGSPLHRRLAAASLKPEPKRDRHSPLARSAKAAAVPNGADSDGSEELEEDPEEAARQQRELADQKARIVAEMADTLETRASSREPSPTGIAPSERPVSPRPLDRPSHRPVTVTGRENSAREPLPTRSSKPSKLASAGSTGSREPTEDRSMTSPGSSKPAVSHKQHVVGRQGDRSPRAINGSGSAAKTDRSPSGGTLFDTFSTNLTRALEDKALGIEDPSSHVNAFPPPPEVFIVSWLDYCNKYGMGYALTDGSIGVHFNDSSSLILAPDREHFDYLSAPSKAKKVIRQNHRMAEFPADLTTKIYLLKHFMGFMKDKLLKEEPWCFRDLERTRGLDFVQRYLRMKHVIVFRLRDVLQFNFYDHAKVILSNGGQTVTYLSNKENPDLPPVLKTWSLAYLLSADAERGTEASVVRSVVKKLRYMDVLLKSIRTGTQPAPGGEKEKGLDKGAREVIR